MRILAKIADKRHISFRLNRVRMPPFQMSFLGSMNSSRIAIISGIAFFLLGVSVLHAAMSEQPHSTPLLPIIFESNHGQVKSDFRYLGHAGPNRVLFSEQEVVLTPHSTTGKDAVRLRFAGARPSLVLGAIEPTEGVSHYYPLSDPKTWVENVPHYKAVKYASVYEGVDVLFHGRTGALEFDFIVRPGADSDQIAFEITGSDWKLEEGAIIVPASGGPLRLQPPIAYQVFNGKRRYIPASFEIAGTKIRFNLGEHDPSQELVIDPVIQWASFVQPVAKNYGLAVDADGNPILANESVVLKLKADGSGVLYKTELGTSPALYSAPRAFLAADGTGAVYVAGMTGRSGFPTTAGAYATTFSGSGSSFLLKLSPAGLLAFSTFTGIPELNSLAIDSQGNSYLVGSRGANLPVLNPLIPDVTSSTVHADGYIQKFNASGSSLLMSSPFALRPGEFSQWYINPLSVAVGADDSVVIGGFTEGPIPLKNPLMAQGWPYENGFRIKLSPGGSTIAAGTLFGAAGRSKILKVGTDATGAMFAIGNTDAADFPTTSDAFQPVCLQREEPFGPRFSMAKGYVAKFDSALSRLVSSTCLHIQATDGAAVTAAGEVYVPGYDYYRDLRLLHPVVNTHANSALIKIGADGKLAMATYLGSVTPLAAANDSNGNVFVLAGTHGVANLPYDPPLVAPLYPHAGCCDFDNPWLAKLSSESLPGVGVSPRQYVIGEPYLRLSNLGSEPLTISALEGPASVSCGSTLGPGETCLVRYQISQDIFRVHSNAPGSPHNFPIQLLNSWPGWDYPDFELSRESVFFGYRQTGHEAAQQTIRFTGLLTPSHFERIATFTEDIQPSPDFFVTHNCPATLLPPGYCDITVGFRPSAAGERKGWLDITLAGVLNPVRIALEGVGTDSTLHSSLKSINFGYQHTAGARLPRTVSITNTGSDQATVQNVAVTGPFAVEHDCGEPLSAGGSCRLQVSFVPSDNQNYEGLVTFNGAPGGAHSISLVGNSRVSSDLAVSPFTLIIRGVIGATATAPLELKNTGQQAHSITSIVFPPGFSHDGSCNTIPAGASCTLPVSYRPTEEGDREQDMVINHTGVGPQIVRLSTTATYPLKLSATEITFPSQRVGTTQFFYISATAEKAPISASAISVNPTGEFALETPASFVLQSQWDFANIGVRFTPTSSGQKSATLTIVSNGRPVTNIPVTGTAWDPLEVPIQLTRIARPRRPGSAPAVAEFEWSAAPSHQPVTFSCSSPGRKCSVEVGYRSQGAGWLRLTMKGSRRLTRRNVSVTITGAVGGDTVKTWQIQLP